MYMGWGPPGCVAAVSTAENVKEADEIDLSVDDLSANLRRLEGKVDLLSCRVLDQPDAASPVSSDAQQIIDLMRRELGTQRKSLDEFYGALQPLAAQLNNLSEEVTSLKNHALQPLTAQVSSLNASLKSVSDEMNMSSLKTLFATNTRLTEVSTDLKLELKTSLANVAASSGESRREAGFKAMGQSISQAVSSAVSNEGIELMRKDLTLKIQELSVKIQALELGKLETSRQTNSHMHETASQFAYSKKVLVDMDTLNTRLNELRAEFQENNKALHGGLEHVACKAGFLSLVASELSAQERETLFSQLKIKERQLSGTQSVQTFLSQYPETISDRQAARNKIVDSSPLEPRGTLHPLAMIPSPSEYIYDTLEKNISVQRQPGMKLGLTLNENSNQELLVESIAAGLISNWNTQNPHQVINEGDRLVAVNGARGTPTELIQMADNPNTRLLSFTFQTRLPSRGSSPRSRESTIQFFRMQDEKLGLSCECDDGTSLLVTGVKVGLVSTWNATHPMTAIGKGDRILSVNGIRDQPRLMLDELDKGGEIVLGLSRA